MNQLAPAKNWNIIYLSLLAIVGVLQMWPWFLLPISTDKFIYQVFMECFSRTIQEGNFRPGWCRFANEELGSPVFYFYFPLAYYFTDFFYPLKQMGKTADNLFTVAFVLVNSFGVCTLYLWVRRHVVDKVAFVIGICCAFVPYRIEAISLTADLSQLLAMGFFPLCLIGMERLIENPRHWRCFVISIALAALSHTMMTFIFAIICGLYVLFATQQFRYIAYFIIAGLMAVLLISYFIIPAYFYSQFVWGEAGTNPQVACVNRYIKWSDFTSGPLRLLILTIIGLLIVSTLYLKIWPHRNMIQRTIDVNAWMKTFICSMVLASPAVGFLYNHSELVRTIFFPWRLQVVFIPVIAVLLIAMSQVSLDKKKMGQRLGNIVVCLLFLHIIQIYQGHRNVMPVRMVDILVEKMFGPLGEYQSKWSSVYVDWSKDDTTYLKIAAIPEFEMKKGRATIKTLSRQGNEWSLQVDVKEPTTLIVKQTYFPTWRGFLNGNPMEIKPSSDGRTEISIEMPGKHIITLKEALYGHAPFWVRISPYISILSMVALVLSYVFRDKLIFPRKKSDAP